MNKCPKCENKTQAEDKFCGICGFKLEVKPGGPALTQKELRVEEVRTNLGIVYFKMGKFAKAIEIFEKNLKVCPDNLISMDMLQKAKEALKR